NELRVGVEEGHRFHRTCASHAQGSAGILNAVRAGMDSIEHGIFMTDECVELMLSKGTNLVPTLSALLNILVNADQGIPEYVVEKTERIKDRHKESVLMFHRAGGKIAMGTDAGTPFNLHGKNQQELKYMVELGIPEKDALVSANVNAADLLGMHDRGRIVEGAYADLLIVEGNPLEDISMVSDPGNHRMVIKNGIPVS
ncbi:MAG: amidohydrolase family protein, partial [SAR324 cluster bacterium]|nr:amidohydrolase family protein [SAR324 cluster bacterium]